MRITGCFAPVPTPFDDGGFPDLEAFHRHLEWLAGEGLDGALVLGSNGEFPCLTIAERCAVARAAAAHAGDLILILGVGSCALPEVEEMLALAAELGYAAALCPPPFYFRRASRDGIASFLARAVEASTLPVLLYHIPQLTGIPLDDDLLDLMGDPARLAGVKDSSGSNDELARLTARFAERSYLVGHDGLVAACRASGGSGSISAAASVAPRLVRAAWHDPSLQPRLSELRKLLERFGLGPAVKALLERSGLGSTTVRPPGVALSPEQREHLFAGWNGLGFV